MRVRSPFSLEGWIGVGLGILGLILILMGSPAELDLIGTMVSLFGLIWALLDRSSRRLEGAMLRQSSELKQILIRMDAKLDSIYTAVTKPGS